MNKKKIMIIATGGTISAAGEEGATIGYKDGAYDVDALVANIPDINQLADLSGENLLNVSSCDISLEDLLKLARRIDELGKSNEYDGFVVTHGTDTLEETSYFLTLILKTSKPVVITGAMRPATATSCDGPLNLYQAILVAAHPDSIGKGVLVAFSDCVYSGRDVQKESTFRTDAFKGRDFGCLGYIRGDDVFFINQSLKRHTLHSEFSLEKIEHLPQVNIAYFGLGADPDYLFEMSKKADGIILAGAGGSSINKTWRGAVRKITDSGLPIIRSSRVGNGITIYDDEMDGESGTIPAMTLPPQKAKVLLALALTKTRERSEIQRIFKEY